MAAPDGQAPDKTPEQIAQDVTDTLLAEDAASRMLGIELLEVRPGYARLAMTVRADMLNGFKMMHGGLTFTLADSAFAFACNSHNKMTVAQSCDVDFTNAAKEGDVLTAECREAFLRGRSGVYDVSVTNQDGVVIALFRGKSRTLGQPIVPSLPQADV
ncbi:hydroxyphenylacetyl-CoA thioesterase PaaI [Hwanghaeella sp.]|uniref:hydroxyphenylacetyl-CoA thioesterase PaaI n=1 Tax=Hwanghaeella sp. TaxID=2605943 RepID=UPI003CCB9F3C